MSNLDCVRSAHSQTFFKNNIENKKATEARSQDAVVKTIGVTARLTAGDPLALGGRRKDQWGIEQTLADWLSATGALISAIPPPPVASNVTAKAWIQHIDALVIQGGGDVQGRPDDSTDRRDAFEFKLLDAALERGIPVLGICRGMQLINVALGGSLRLVNEETASTGVHSDPRRYETHTHAIRISAGDHRDRVYACDEGEANSMHRYGVDRLASGLVVEAWCPIDDSIEAIRVDAQPWVRGVQWHPEFHHQGMLPTMPMLRDFLDAADNG